VAGFLLAKLRKFTIFTIMIKFLYSRCLFALCVCASLSLFACSDEKDPPTIADKCKTTPVTEDCIIGNWRLDGTDYYDCRETGHLELSVSESGERYFAFEGGANNINSLGEWSLNNGVITITYSDVIPTPTSGTVSVTNGGNSMTIIGNTRATVSLCSNGKEERFTRN